MSILLWLLLVGVCLLVGVMAAGRLVSAAVARHRRRRAGLDAAGPGHVRGQRNGSSLAAALLFVALWWLVVFLMLEAISIMRAYPFF